jgi:hypothetical protein
MNGEEQCLMSVVAEMDVGNEEVVEKELRETQVFPLPFPSDIHQPSPRDMLPHPHQHPGTRPRTMTNHSSSPRPFPRTSSINNRTSTTRAGCLLST